MVRRFFADAPDFKWDFDALVEARREADEDVSVVVREVIAAVRRDGDDALRAYTWKWDRHDLDQTGWTIGRDAEEVEDDREHWRLDAYFEVEPDATTIDAIRALVPSAGDHPATVEHVPAQDWVTMSQAGLEPLSVGRFFVHTGDETVPEGKRGFHIPAGRAFGTGHHETTSGCLAMLDAMAGETVTNAIDVGTGTGLLAFAVRHLWSEAMVVATDIDPIAIDVTADNAVINGVDGVALIVADGALAR